MTTFGYALAVHVDCTPDELAAFVIDAVGHEFAADVRDVFAIESDAARCELTAAWYWTSPSARWPSIDRVIQLQRYDVVRAMTVEGLATALGPVVPKPHRSRARRPPILPGDPNYGRGPSKTRRVPVAS